MPTDGLTRLLLAGILACLVVLVIQGFGSDPPAAAGALEAGDVGRYRVITTRAGTPLLIRTDTVTGRAWKLELRGGRDRWVELVEPGEGGRADAAAGDEPAPESSPAAIVPTAPDAASTGLGSPPAADAGGASSDDDLHTWLEAARKPELPTDIRRWAVTQLGGSDDPRATDALAAALGDADPRVAAAAVAAVASRRDDPRVAEALDALGSSTAPEVRAALDALAPDN